MYKVVLDKDTKQGNNWLEAIRGKKWRAKHNRHIKRRKKR